MHTVKLNIGSPSHVLLHRWQRMLLDNCSISYIVNLNRQFTSCGLGRVYSTTWRFITSLSGHHDSHKESILFIFGL